MVPVGLGEPVSGERSDQGSSPQLQTSSPSDHDLLQVTLQVCSSLCPRPLPREPFSAKYFSI